MNRVKLKEKKPLFKRKRDNYAAKLKREELIKYLRSELESSTTHGLPYIVNSDIHWFERAYWAINFLVCTGLVFYLLFAQYSRFAETPIVMSVEMDYFNWNVSYPAFTLCPLMKVDSEAFGALLNETNLRTEKNLETYLWFIILVNTKTIEKLKQPSPELIPLIDPKDYAKIAVSVFKQLDNSSITTNTNWPISVETAMTERGLCHVINSNVAVFDNPAKWSTSATAYAKNNIELSVHDKDFFTQITNYAGNYNVYIHSPDDTILSTTSSYTHDDKGFLSLGVQVWSTRISDELRHAWVRFRRCRLIHEPISKRYPVYSYSHCMLECRIKMILRLCGCVPHFYKTLDHERTCNVVELKCFVQYKKEIMSLSTYNATLKKFYSTKDLPRTSRDCGCLSRCESDLYLKDYENFVPHSDINRLRIGISSFPKVRVVRDIIFSYYDIILRIGGAVNLCIGSSMLSMMEFLLTILRIPILRLAQVLKF